MPAVERLRAKGYDLLTVQEAGNANQRIPDEDVLAFSTSQNRAVITQNRRDFILLHNQGIIHTGIVVCTKNLNWDSFAFEIDLVLKNKDSLEGELIRVNRPAK